MRLYLLLGVEPNDTVEIIKEAFRRLAMKHHPDRGGDKARMQEIQEAYDVLSDLERRKRYDELGASDRPVPVRDRALATLNQILEKVLDASPEMDFTDPVQAMRDIVHQELKRGAEIQKEVCIHLVRRRTALKRLRRSGDLPLLEAILEQKILAVEQKLRSNQEGIDMFHVSLDILANYTYDKPSRDC